MKRNAMTGLLASAILLTLLPASQARAEEGWQWVVAPYLWASSVKSDLNEDLPPIGSETQFNDIVSKLDMAFQMRVEGQGDRFGMFADVTYLALSDSATRSLYSSDASFEATLVEAGGVWNVSPERYEGLDVLFGVRYVKADLDADLEPSAPLLPDASVRFEDTYVDALLGVRYTSRLSEAWTMTYRVDGAFGQTDGTWNASIMAGYKMKRGSLLFGYRHMDMELGKGGRSLDVTMSGPVIAYAFGF